jgi:transcriptional regulator with GAF, ATPase, and Fis domain
MPPWSVLTSPHGRGGNDALFPDVDGASPVMRTLKQHMLRVAEDGDVTVLILGESGTGKERVARAIHDRSPRQRSPFVVVNCAGLSPALVDDELFGHVRGAFTGAVQDRAGPFERAAGGTVFLDEIGDLPLDLQMKLLRALQQRAVQRLGGERETTFDARVIAATNVDLDRAVTRGRFRADLYFRLKVYELQVPPLRRRGGDDIAALARTIARRLGERRRRGARAIEPAVLDVFARYRWPGNVRELENTIERMVVASGKAPALTTEHLPDGFVGRALAYPRVVRLPPFDDDRGVPSDEEVVAALEGNGFNRQRAADALGLSRHQLYRLVRQRRSLASRLGRASAR